MTRKRDDRQHAATPEELMRLLVEDYPTRPLVVREQPALAVLFDAGQGMPNTAFQAQRPTVVVYGASRKGDDRVGMLGDFPLDQLEKHPEGQGTRIRIYSGSPWTALSAVQVDQLRRLAAREPRRPALTRLSPLAERSLSRLAA